MCTAFFSFKHVVGKVTISAILIILSVYKLAKLWAYIGNTMNDKQKHNLLPSFGIEVL